MRIAWRKVAVGVGMAAVAVGSTGIPRHAVAAIPSGVVYGHVPVAAAATSATIVIKPGAIYHGYSTRSVTISQGGSLKVVNHDTTEHTVTSQATDSNGHPLFDTHVFPGKTASIPGASTLAPGTYQFHCRFHPSMTGKLTVESGSGGGGGKPPPQSFLQPLQLPPVLTDAHLQIPIEQAPVQMLPSGPATQMWTFGGSYPGPTIERPAGQDTKVTFANNLPAQDGSVTVHFHGDHHTSANDGQPTRHLIAPGGQRTYDYPLTERGRPERAAFNFYHDHRMGWTARNNWNGLQGMFITTDAKERSLGLPSGSYDVPMLISDRSFTSDNQLTEPFPSSAPPMAMTGPSAPPNDHTVGNDILVDGRYAPYLDVATHHYRLRLLNASAFTSYDFELSDGRRFVQVGSGDSLLPNPVRRRDILLGPAQRADVIVNFTGELNKNVVLESVPRVSGSPRGVGTPSASIMQFRVDSSVPDSTQIPSALEAAPRLRAPKKVSAHWTFGLAGDAQTSGSYWTVNGKPFNPRRVDLKVPLGSTQTWVLRNASPITHYIHIHEEDWQEISRDGKPPPPYERGLQDTWRLDPGEKVKVAAKFTDYTGIFMIHCHMLDHEDHGMMAQWAVVKRKGSALPKGYHYSGAAVTGRHATRPRAVSGSGMAGMSMPVPGSDVTGPIVRTTIAWGPLAGRAGLALAVELLVVAALARRLRRARIRARRVVSA